MRRLTFLAAGLALLAGVASAVSEGATQAETRWVITDLGTLGGKRVSAEAINDRGQVVGWGETKAKEEDSEIKHAFLWEDGKMRDLGTLEGERYSYAYDINERGQVVGWSKNESWTATGHAFLWQSGKMIDLGSLPGAEYSYAKDINNHGQVVGWSSGRKTDYPRAFLWEDGKMRDLGTLGGVRGEATAINERGQVVGWSGTGSVAHAFLWERGRMIDLGTLPGFLHSEAVAISERGQVIGWARRGKMWGEQHAFLWKRGKMTDLGALARGEESEAVAVNGRGLVVGWSGRIWDPRAALWEKGSLRHLTLGGKEGWAADISERGQIVGWSDTKSGQRHAFLWQQGRMTDLGTLPGLQSSGAGALNERDQIIGSSGVHAVLWTLKR